MRMSVEQWLNWTFRVTITCHLASVLLALASDYSYEKSNPFRIQPSNYEAMLLAISRSVQGAITKSSVLQILSKDSFWLCLCLALNYLASQTIHTFDMQTRAGLEKRLLEFSREIASIKTQRDKMSNTLKLMETQQLKRGDLAECRRRLDDLSRYLAVRNKDLGTIRNQYLP